MVKYVKHQCSRCRWNLVVKEDFDNFCITPGYGQYFIHLMNKVDPECPKCQFQLKSVESNFLDANDPTEIIKRVINGFNNLYRQK